MCGLEQASLGKESTKYKVRRECHGRNGQVFKLYEVER